MDSFHGTGHSVRTLNQQIPNLCTYTILEALHDQLPSGNAVSTILHS